MKYNDPTGMQHYVDIENQKKTSPLMQTQTTTVKKVIEFIPDCPEYNVLLNDRIIGKVYRGWWRLGGVAWSHSERPTFHSGFKTRQEAITDLIKKSESKPLIEVIANEPDWQWTGRGIEYKGKVISTQNVIKFLNETSHLTKP